MKNKKPSTTLKIKFSTQRELDNFASWLSEMGEQSYREYMKYQPKNTVHFIFHHPLDKRFNVTDERRCEKAKFCNNNTILTEKYREEE